MKLKHVLMIAAVFLLFACVVGPVSAFSGTGSGTAASPYIVTTVTQLNEVRDDLGAYYQLGADINLGSSGWTPIGSYTDASVNSPFTGVFDGNGHTISNLQINSPDSSYLGLFGYIADDAVIRYVHLVNVTISGNNYLGGIAGFAEYSTVQNCSVSGAITGNVKTGSAIGGVAGYAYDYTIITDSSFSGNVSGKENIGGLVGMASISEVDCVSSNSSVYGKSNLGGLVGFMQYPTGNISQSSFSGTIYAREEGLGVGGLIGSVDNSDYPLFVITTCNTNIIIVTDGSSAYPDNVGGLVGESVGSLLIDDSVVSGEIQLPVHRWTNQVGGLVGLSDIIQIHDSLFTGNITGGYNVGGLLGMADNAQASISNSSVDGSVAGYYCTGGMVGLLNWRNYDKNPSCYITNCSADVTLSGKKIGGLVASADAVTEIRDCDVSGSITTADSDSVDGGLVGSLGSYGSIMSSEAHVTITSIGTAGGFIGSLGRDAVVSDSLSTGSVSGKENVGGFVGKTGSSSQITDCSAMGDVTGTGASVGGFVGFNYDGTIECCFASGDVTGGSKEGVGGFVGNHYSGVIRDCYATGSVSSLGVSVGGFAGEFSTGSGELINCYATGDVSSSHASAAVGGLIGSGSGTFGSATIENSVALNQMLTGKTGGTQGRIAASHSEPEKYLTNNYGLSSMVIKIGREESTPSASVLNGENVNPETAQTQAFYTGLGWDFTKVWAMDKSISPYPIFRWQTDTPEIPVTPTVNTTETVSAAVPLGVGYELSPSKISEVTAPTVTRGKLSIVLDEKVVVTKSVGGTETAVAASVNADGSAKITGDISDAESLTVTFVGRKLGDISRDDRIGIVDMLSVGQHIVKINELDDKGQFYGDISGDGKIGIVDMLSIGQYIVGIADENYEKRK